MIEAALDRPVITFALFAYNQEEYIYEAVMGALSQNYYPLEIFLSDDCSTDQTFQIMKKIVATYEGPHRLRLRRNKKNLGLAEHVNVVMNAVQGDIIVLAAGDDISVPTRVEKSVKLLAEHPDASAVLLSAEIIDQSGESSGQRKLHPGSSGLKVQSLDDLLRGKAVTFGASRAIRAGVFRVFGNLNKDCPTEDTPFLLRSLMTGSNILSNEIGIRYRIHEENLSGNKIQKNFPHHRILSQYNNDVDTALSAGLINLDMSKKIGRWSLDNHQARKALIKIQNGDVDLDAIKAIVFSKSMTLKRKVRALLTAFARQGN